ncbi:MAG: tRNA (N(6)-L-threonylcarbamoyladenosine(37)-C(2))-methylthiotransferase MtaB [Saccharofermentans sp.]|nr:tRNA (N(6)-L-threonylcarbamoyladenosine(37)-C(2))-methylthiotransferase MtaB [Saccharofermentans sp.]
MKVYFLTLGCRVNQYETDAARRLFLDNGHENADTPEEADICIVNTCSVTGEADRKSSQMLRRMAKNNPDAVIVAMGCASELKNGEVPADIVIGTRDKNTVVNKVEEFLAHRENELTHRASHVRPEVSKTDEYHDFGTVLSPEGTRAFIKIEDGCNNFCTFCVIPYARGRVVSRSEESCMKEAGFLVSNGFKELIVSGIHLCSYGKDQGRDISALLELLKKIDSIEGLERLRLGSLEPKSMTPEFISGLKELKHLCPHFHLSLQSGSDTVLKRMNRKYTTEEYEDRVKALRAEFPDMSLTTDIITGFPEETEEEFRQTMEFAERLKFAKIHVFPYSEREGTKAASMPQMDMSIRKERARRLIELSDSLAAQFASGMTGHKAGILVERVTVKDGKHYAEGYTSNYIRTFADIEEPGDTEMWKGRLISGTVYGAEADTCLLRPDLLAKV